MLRSTSISAICNMLAIVLCNVHSFNDSIVISANRMAGNDNRTVVEELAVSEGWNYEKKAKNTVPLTPVFRRTNKGVIIIEDSSVSDEKLDNDPSATSESVNGMRTVGFRDGNNEYQNAYYSSGLYQNVSNDGAGPSSSRPNEQKIGTGKQKMLGEFKDQRIISASDASKRGGNEEVWTVPISGDREMQAVESKGKTTSKKEKAKKQAKRKRLENDIELGGIPIRELGTIEEEPQVAETEADQGRKRMATYLRCFGCMLGVMGLILVLFVLSFALKFVL